MCLAASRRAELRLGAGTWPGFAPRSEAQLAAALVLGIPMDGGERRGAAAAGVFLVRGEREVASLTRGWVWCGVNGLIKAGSEVQASRNGSEPPLEFSPTSIVSP